MLDRDTTGPAGVAWGRGACVVLVATAALTLPFLGKPFHIDDDIYLKSAQQILREPANPLGGTQHLFGEVMPTYHFTQHPPLLSYYVAAVLKVAGIHERRLHASFLVFPCLAAFATYALSRRFTSSPVSTTLLVVATPAFAVMAHGLMTDVPFLALYTATLAVVIHALDGGRRDLAVLGAVGLASAGFVQYRGFLLVPLLAAYAWLHGRPLRTVALTAAPALVGLGLWCAHNAVVLGVVHLLDAGTWMEMGWSRITYDAAAYVSYLGGATLAVPLVIYAGLRCFPTAWTWVGVLAASGVLVALFTGGFTTLQRGLFATFVTTGLTLLVCAVPPDLRHALRRRWAGSATREEADDLFLALLVVVPFASQVFLNVFASVRSLLVVLPFLVLLLVRRLERRGGAASAAWAGIAWAGATAIVISVADLRFAQAHQELARRLAAHRPSGRTAWLTGEWGLRHYLEREGFVPGTARGDGARPGDVVVVPDLPSPVGLAPAFLARLDLADTLASTDAFPLKVMSFEARAGFYSSFWGPLPYSVSDAPLERVRVFRVRSAE